MTDLITAEDVERILNLLRSETEAASRTDAADMIEALHAELTQARADAKAAVAIVVEKADFEVQEVSDNCETDGERLAIMSAVDRVRALAPEDAIAEVAKLRAEIERLDRSLDASQKTQETYRVACNNNLAMQRAATAELAAANAREAGLRALLINRDGGSHDEDCKARRYANSDGLCNCGHDEVVAALAQPSTEGDA